MSEQTGEVQRHPPQRVTREEIQELDEGGRGDGGRYRRRPSSGGSGGGMMQYIISAILSLVIAFGMISFVSVSKEDFTTNIQGMNAKIAASSAAVTANTASTDKALANMAGSITTQVSSAMSSMENRVSTAESNANNANSQVSGLNNQITNTTAQVSALTNTINNMENANSTLVKSLSDANVKIDALTKLEDANAAEIVKLQKAKATQTEGTGGTAGVLTPGQVTVAVLGNTFTGSQILQFNLATGAVSPATGTANGSQSFVFQIANGLDATIKGMHLGIGLQVMDTNGNPYTPPSGMTVSVQSADLGILWTQQTTGYAYYLGYINTALGIFGGSGTLSQPAGITNYTITVTAQYTGSGTAQFNVMPIVKIVSYS